MSPDEQARLRARLPRTFAAFYDRFPRLLPVQCAAVEPLVSGKSALITAPTAGGKTEAAMAPLLQRVLDAAGRDLEGPALLYVSPTRALVNDVYRRLTVPVERLGLTLARRTGEYRPTASALPHVLVTTPESFDSMVARMPKRLLPVRCLLLDELHALDGGPRGDQLAAVCERLRKIRASAGGELQVAILSATVERPEDVAARYAPDCVVVRDPGTRKMTANVALVPFTVPPTQKLAELVDGTGGKILVFCNARADVEWAAGQLKGKLPFGSRVWAHHGSLSQRVREQAEKEFQHARTAVCFATSTLELGIDIGDVDHAVLYGVPPDVPTLLQRVGRAGRRSGSVRFLAIARDRGEILRFRHLMQAARAGRLLTDPAHYDPSTVLQQAMSLLLQNPSRAIAPSHVLDRLPAWQAEWWTEDRLEAALEHASDWFHRIAKGHFTPTEQLERTLEIGTMHGNIGGEAEVEVLEELTGRSLGTIADRASDDAVLLGGRTHEVRQASDGSLRASLDRDAVGEARFTRKPAPPIPRALAQDVMQWIGLDPVGIHRVEGEDETWFLLGLGTVAGTLLHASAGARVVKRPGRGVAFGLRFKSGHADWPGQIVEPERLRLVARDISSRLTRQLGFGPWFRFLPVAERHRAVLAALETEVISRRLQVAQVHEVHDEELRKKVRSLMTQ